MLPQSSALSRPRRRLGFVLLGLIVLVTGSAGGVVLWQRLHTPKYQHVPNAVNTGVTILYLSAPGFESEPTLLTMVRSRDGATLWQYSLPKGGRLSTGYVPTIDEALAQGQAVTIANGVIYFVVDPDYLGSPGRELELTALRAADGTLLWQRPVRGATVVMFGVSDGVVCLLITQQQGSQVASSALAGYERSNRFPRLAATGKRLHQVARLHLQHVPARRLRLRLGGASRSSLSLYALVAHTGETLWQYTPPASSPTHAGQFAVLGVPVAVDEGVVVLSAATISLSAAAGGALVGVRESDGTVLWRYQTSAIITNVPHGGFNAPGIVEQGGALYFGTNAAETGLQLTSLQVTTGRLLWRKTVSTSNLVLWDLVVGSGRVYALLVPQWSGLHHSFDGLALTALDASDGTLRWQQHPAETFPYVAATGDVVVLASQTGLDGLNAADGATQWHMDESAAPSHVAAVADGTPILSAAKVSGPQTWAATLCGMQQSTGTMRWCDHFVTGLAAVVPGP